MTLALTLFRSQVTDLISADNTELSESARDERVKSALEKYSHDAPDEYTEDVTGDGGKYYSIAASLTEWVEGFSRVKEIEYPAATIASDEQPQYLEREDWIDDYFQDESDVQVRYLYLPNHAPAATETMRITYTRPYTFTGGTPACDIPTQDFFAVCHLAAALCCDALSAKYARIGDSTVNVDSAAHVTKSQEFARQAKRFMELYNQHMGIGQEQKVEGTGDFVDWDTAPGWPIGRQYVFHRNR